MKYIVGILALFTLLVSLGRDGLCQVNPPVTGPVAPAQPFGPFVAQGLTITNAPGGASPTRPTFGYPSWTGTVALYQDPAVCCLAEYTHFALPDNRMGFGAVTVWTYDKRWPAGARWFDHPGPAYYAGSWADDIPLRSPTLGYFQSGANDGTGHGIIFVITDMKDYPEQSSLYQITYLIMDWYAQVTICTQANFTGVCHVYGYGCTQAPNNFCHGDTAAERSHSKDYTDIDVRGSTADALGVPYPHLSFRVGYGF